jgi:hypothetical protein
MSLILFLAFFFRNYVLQKKIRNYGRLNRLSISTKKSVCNSPLCQKSFSYHVQDPLEDYRNPVVAASSFIVELISKRKKETLVEILTFLNQVFEKYTQFPASLELAREKDGALYLMSCMADILSSKVSATAAYFLLRLTPCSTLAFQTKWKHFWQLMFFQSFRVPSHFYVAK